MSEFQPRPPSDPTMAPAVPPGWYFDGAQQRWWDGRAWGAVQAGSDDRTLATLSHLGVVLGGFIVPLIMYLVSDDETRPETRYHAREALNFHLTCSLLSLPLFIVYFAVLISQAGGGGNEPTVDVFSILASFVVIAALVLVAFVASITVIVLGVRAAVRANRGERYRYPLCIRLVKG